MHRRIQLVVVAVAATLIIALAASLGWWPSMSTDGSAFAGVQQEVRKIRSVTYNMLEHAEGEAVRTTHVMLSGSDLMRAEYPDGQIVVANMTQGQQMRVLPREKKVIIERAFPLAASLNPLEQICNIAAGATEKLPPREIEGQKAVGFMIRDKGYAGLKVWVDPDTKLPLMFESSTEYEGGRTVREITTDFRYDGQLDSSLFRIAPPTGYTVESHLEEQQPPTEAGKHSTALEVKAGVGVGPVRFGMSKDDVARCLGKPSTVTKNPIEGEILEYNSLGLWLSFKPDKGIHHMVCLTQVAQGFRVRDFPGKTDKGIGMGATPEEVETAYGKPDITFNVPNGFMGYGRLATTFEFRDNRLYKLILVGPKKRPTP